jgi:carbon storage regulator
MTMLVLSRGVGERIQIGDQIEVVVVRIAPGLVRIGIEAPAEMPIVREEIQLPPPDENKSRMHSTNARSSRS